MISKLITKHFPINSIIYCLAKKDDVGKIYRAKNKGKRYRKGQKTGTEEGKENET